MTAPFFDTTRSRLQYTRPAPGPDPLPSEGIGDPNGERFGGHYSLWCGPFALNELWVYQDGQQPEVTYSVGHIVPNGQTTGRSWARETRTVDAIYSDTLTNFNLTLGRLWSAPPATTVSTVHLISVGPPHTVLGVASTVGFQPSGSIAVDGQVVTYSGTTPTAFTGCNGLDVANIGDEVVQVLTPPPVTPGDLIYARGDNTSQLRPLAIRWQTELVTP